jgi:hypothetical protein
MTKETTTEDIQKIWIDIEKKLESSENVHQRTYRRLDLEKETGIRLGCASPGSIWELLIEAGISGEDLSIKFPKWKGMYFEILSLDVPKKDTLHIRLCLEQRLNRDIFVTVCADLIRTLNGCLTNQSRKKEIISFLTRWSIFFEQHGQDGLTSEAQRGLYGELWWLRCMIKQEVSLADAVNSWKGCRRNYHDFEINGHIVEVKTTMTKEPHKVQINNERQLDDRGMNSLYLFALIITKSSTGGETLPDLVKSLRDIFSGDPIVYIFDNSLREAGYLDIHASIYNSSSYSLIKEEFFHVGEGFPRITNVPSGLGDLNYTLVLSACKEFKYDYSEYFIMLKR